MRSGRVITFICIVILLVACFWWWRDYHSANPYDGTVRREAATEPAVSTTETSRHSAEVHPTPSRSDTPGTLNGEPYPPNQDAIADRIPPAESDPNAPAAPSSPQPVIDRGQRGEKPGTEYIKPSRFDRNPEAPETPASSRQAKDSLPIDNPDGARFGGSGPYQWYRQGDLTYRIDTRNGTSCIIYATMEEWHKPFVYRHGCRAN